MFFFFLFCSITTVRTVQQHINREVKAAVQSQNYQVSAGQQGEVSVLPHPEIATMTYGLEGPGFEATI